MELFYLTSRKARLWYRRCITALVATVMLSIPVLSTVLMAGCVPGPGQTPPAQASYTLSQTSFHHSHAAIGVWNLQLRRNGVNVSGATFTVVGTPTTGLRLSGTSGVTLNSEILPGTTGTININVSHGGQQRITNRQLTVTRAADPNGGGNGNGPGNGGTPPERDIQDIGANFWLPVDFSYVSRVDENGQLIAERDAHFGSSSMDYVSIPFGTPINTEANNQNFQDGRRPHVFYNRHTGVAFCNMGAVWTGDGADTTRDIFASRIGEVVRVSKDHGNHDNGKQFGMGNYILIRHEIGSWPEMSNMITLSLRHVGPIIRLPSARTVMYTKYSNLMFNGIFVEEGDIVGGTPTCTFRGRLTSRPYGVPIAKMGRTGFTGNDNSGAVDQLYFQIYKYVEFSRLIGENERYRVYLNPLDGERVMFVNMRDRNNAIQRSLGRPWVYVQEATGGHLMAEMFMWAGADAGVDPQFIMNTFLPESFNQFVSDATTMITAGIGLYNNFQDMYTGFRSLFGGLNAIEGRMDSLWDAPFNRARGHIEGWLGGLFTGATAELQGLRAYLQQLEIDNPAQQAEIQVILGMIDNLPVQFNSNWQAAVQASLTVVLERLRATAMATLPVAITSFRSTLNTTLGIGTGNTPNFGTFLNVIQSQNKGPEDIRRLFTAAFYTEFTAEFRRVMNIEFQNAGMFLLNDLQTRLLGSVIVTNDMVKNPSEHDFIQLALTAATNEIMNHAPVLFQDRMNDAYTDIIANVSAVLTGSDIPGGNNTRLTNLIMSLQNRTHSYTRGTIGEAELMNALQAGIATEMRKFANRIGATVADRGNPTMNGIMNAIGADGTGVHNLGARASMLAHLIVFNEVAMIRASTGLGGEMVWGQALERIEEFYKNMNTRMAEFRTGLMPFTATLSGDFDGILKILSGETEENFTGILGLFRTDVMDDIQNDDSLMSQFIESAGTILAGFTDGTYFNMINNMRRNIEGIFNSSLDWSDLARAFSFMAVGMDTWISTETVNNNERPESISAEMSRIFNDMSRNIQRAFRVQTDLLWSNIQDTMGDMTTAMFDALGDMSADLALHLQGAAGAGFFTNLEDNMEIHELINSFISAEGDDGIADMLTARLMDDGLLEQYMEEKLIASLSARAGRPLNAQTRIMLNDQSEFEGLVTPTALPGILGNIHLAPVGGMSLEEVATRLSDDQFNALVDSLRLEFLAHEFNISNNLNDLIRDASFNHSRNMGNWGNNLAEAILQRVTQFLWLYQEAYGELADSDLSEDSRVIIDHTQRSVSIVDDLSGSAIMELSEENFALAVRYMLEEVKNSSQTDWSGFNGTDADPIVNRVETLVNYLTGIYGYVPAAGSVNRDTWVRISFARQSISIRPDLGFFNIGRNIANSPVAQRAADIVVSSVAMAWTGFKIGGAVTANPYGAIIGAAIGGIIGGITAAFSGPGIASMTIQETTAIRIRQLTDGGHMHRLAAGASFAQRDLNDAGREADVYRINTDLSAKFFGPQLLEDILGDFAKVTEDLIPQVRSVMDSIITGEGGMSDTINSFMAERVASLNLILDLHMTKMQTQIQGSIEVMIRTMQRIIEDALQDAIEIIKVAIFNYIIDVISAVIHESLGNSLGRALGFILPPTPIGLSFNVERGIAINIGNAVLAWFGFAEWTDVVYPVVRNTPWFTTFNPGLIVPPHHGGVTIPTVERNNMINQAFRTFLIDTNYILLSRQTTVRELERIEAALRSEQELITSGIYTDFDQFVQSRLNTTRNRLIGVSGSITDIEVRTALDYVTGWDAFLNFDEMLEVLVNMMYIERLAVVELARLEQAFVAA